MFRALIFALLPLLLFAKPNNNPDAPLRIGMEMGNPPFEMLDEEGNPSGISADLAYALGDYLGREINIKDMVFIDLIPALRADKIDLIISSLTVSQEREKLIAFSTPYIRSGLCLLISASSDVQNISQADQESRILTVQRGTTGESWARKHLKKAQLVALDSINECAQLVVKGQADAFIYDQIFLYDIHEQYPDATRVNLVPFQEEFWAIGLRKKDRALLKEVNAFLQEFRKEGGFEKLANRYLKEQKKAFAQMGVPFYF